ncbi:hypothetical protein M378DRAFT_760868 [Amanita muscaria Koide BX008]|uniref:Uncharacterized protein n=1 Tax=Amanita muscaria (strain Koide BX008) TaxID=946122 RepID=A0A0C2T7C7_AMAMK|nr:hypothetical protein M378DRAFT_760868 [Amanita muscaria Koide BX008]
MRYALRGQIRRSLHDNDELVKNNRTGVLRALDNVVCTQSGRPLYQCKLMKTAILVVGQEVPGPEDERWGMRRYLVMFQKLVGETVHENLRNCSETRKEVLTAKFPSVDGRPVDNLRDALII